MKTKANRPDRGSPQEDILDAIHNVMSHELDRKLLLIARQADGPLSWSGLHRRVGTPSRQPYQDALDRLHEHVLIQRQVRPAGRHHRTFITAGPRGIKVADMLLGIANQGRIPSDTDADIRDAVQQEILATHLYATA